MLGTQKGITCLFYHAWLSINTQRSVEASLSLHSSLCTYCFPVFSLFALMPPHWSKRKRQTQDSRKRTKGQSKDRTGAGKTAPQ